MLKIKNVYLKSINLFSTQHNIAIAPIRALQWK